MRIHWRFWLGMLISAILVVIVLREQNLPEVWYALQNAKYFWLLPGVAVYFLGVWARTWRWHYLLRPLKEISMQRLFPLVCIGYMGNNIYPARAGELLRSYTLKQRTGIAISASLATVVVERLFDGLTMLLFVFITLPIAGLGSRYSTFVALFSLLFIGALVVFLLLAAMPKRAQAIYGWLIDRLLPDRLQPRVRETLDLFLEGLYSLRRGRDVMMIFVTSVVIWLFETGKYWFVMYAFPFHVDFYVLMLMNGVVNLFTTLPAAPGYIGTFDAPGIEILENFGVAGNVATAYTAVLHAALWLPITALGAFYLWREHLSWAEVRTEVAAEPPVDEAPLGMRSGT
ncbi:MAG: lysylphosphatidylglycerol synthase transmembrane domain-containing protein [Anaerolineae bacterium]